MNRSIGQMPEEETTKNGVIMKGKEWSEDDTRQTRRWRFAALLLGCVVILLGGVLLVLFWQIHGQPVSHGNTTVNTPVTPPSNSAPGSPQVEGTPPAWPIRYKDAAKQEIATELNLSLVQMKDRLSQHHVSLFEVTMEQGVQSDQVFPLWLNALQDAGNLMIKVGTWTPPQADSYWHYWSDYQKSALGQKNMDTELSRWFTEG